MLETSKLFYGAVINPISLDKYDAHPNCLISVGPSGDIEWTIEDVATDQLASILAEKGIRDSDSDIIRLSDGEFLMPGFIDTHTHAVQFPSLGTGGQKQLLGWLLGTVFPGESKFDSKDYALSVFPSVIRRTLDCGTTTACYYSSLHLDATKVLAETALVHGQRAFVGKCNMDDPRGCPEYYIEKDLSLADTKEVIAYIRALPGNNPPLVHPILSPRFALSCTEELLCELGDYAETDTSLRIQTHYAENTQEVEDVKSRFGVKYYVDVYDDAKLLRHNTILGHGVHVEDRELVTIRRKGAGIAHCPSSNKFLRSGLAPIGHYLDYGVKVGLATDVSGGTTPSMLENIQEASKISKDLATPDNSETKAGVYVNRILSLATLLYLATLGGADLCDMKDTLGSFAPGKSFDALLVSTRTPESGPSLWVPNDLGVGEHALHELFERFIFCGDDRNISKVWVQGKFVGGKLWKESSSLEGEATTSATTGQ